MESTAGKLLKKKIMVFFPIDGFTMEIFAVPYVYFDGPIRCNVFLLHKRTSCDGDMDRTTTLAHPRVEGCFECNWIG